MKTLLEIIPIALLATDLLMVASGRLMHCIKLVAVQGILLGLLPLALHWNGNPEAVLLLLSGLNLSVKGVLLPCLLVRAMRKADVRRELEPFVGYSASLFLILGVCGVCFWICHHWQIGSGSASSASVPVAFTTMLTGLFIIIARRKAITQAIGFLVFENSVSLFGTAMMLEHGVIVELGILLDVFVLVFVMGIAVFHINREFSHIDSDKLNRLGDWSVPEHEERGEELES